MPELPKFKNPFGGSNPFDEEAQQSTQDIVTDVLSSFATSYPKEFVKACAMEAMEGEEESEAMLLENSPPEVRKEGWMVKEGAVRKNWKKRWFVVDADYNVKYYASPAVAAKGGKPKGSFSPLSYKVDKEEGKEDKMIVLKPYWEDDLAKRTYRFKCETEEEFEEWAKFLGTATHNAANPMHEDGVRQEAFNASFEALCDAAGYYARWTPKGSENNMLCYIINKRVYREILREKVFPKITVSNETLKRKMEQKVLSVVSTTIVTAVDAAWKAATAAVDAISDPTKEAVGKVVGPIGEAISGAKDKIGENLQAALGPVCQAVLSKVPVECLTTFLKVVAEHYCLLMKFYAEESDKGGSETAPTPRAAYGLNWKFWYSNFSESLYAADEIAEMVDGDKNALWDLRDQCYGGAEALLMNALYTFHVNKDRNVAGFQLLNDAKASMTDIAKGFLSAIITPKLMGEVSKLSEEFGGQIEVPEQLADFFDPVGIIDEIAENFIDEQLQVFVDHEDNKSLFDSLDAALKEAGVEAKEPEASTGEEKKEDEEAPREAYAPRPSIAIADPDEVVDSDSDNE
jgi:hypothetical protein